jgi:hypothetical protein
MPPLPSPCREAQPPLYQGSHLGISLYREERNEEIERERERREGEESKKRSRERRSKSSTGCWPAAKKKMKERVEPVKERNEKKEEQREHGSMAAKKKSRSTHGQI